MDEYKFVENQTKFNTRKNNYTQKFVHELYDYKKKPRICF